MALTLVAVNSVNDRETYAYTAWDYLSALLSSMRCLDQNRHYAANKLISHVVYLEGCKVDLDVAQIEVRPSMFMEPIG